MSGRVGWLDCSSGVSGDMLLGALSALGAVDVQDVIDTLGVSCDVQSATVRRGPMAATLVQVVPAADQPRRGLADLTAQIDASGLDAEVRRRATAVFTRLATAEARVHGTTADTVDFHEVGAVDALVDIVGACVGLQALGLDHLVASPIALGGGRASTLHGPVPVPVPAVLELLRGSTLTSYGGPVDRELATPTGVAVLTEWATGSGDMPTLAVADVGIGAGGHDLVEQPNVLRLVVGAPADPAAADWQLLEANVDDLDPRLWPGILARLLAAGAADAWLTPIVMKKGRSAHTLSALVAAGDAADAVARIVFTESSTIGLRMTTVSKQELPRDWIDVDIEGHTVRVKVARLDGSVVNVSPEFDDVVRAADGLDRPVKWVLAAASAAAHARLS